jgi:hypothetical protein
MNIYEASLFTFQPDQDIPGKPLVQWISEKLNAWRRLRAAKETDAVLASLDAATLEDIGIPHVGTSPCAGLLDRHPRVIALRCLM